MILKETILSAFTERGTLLKWLKKVEAALNADVLTDISLEQIDETHVKLKFTFENGNFVESPVLALPRGATGATGAIGPQGPQGPEGPQGPQGLPGLDGEGIAATIEVGTVTTGAAGTDASVTNVGTEQRAVLNFVIPRGDTGASGEQGTAGVGFDDASEISINDGAINITAGDNGVNIEASFEVAVGDEVLEIPATMYLPLKGSESIVIDVDESGDFIDIHLDTVIAAKLGRVLVTPMSAPASVSLVAVDTSNAQTLLTIGDGLSVSGNVLSASGGGGGSSVQTFSLTFNAGDDYTESLTKGSGRCLYINAQGEIIEHIFTYGYPERETISGIVKILYIGITITEAVGNQLRYAYQAGGNPFYFYNKELSRYEQFSAAYAGTTNFPDIYATGNIVIDFKVDDGPSND